MTQCSSCGGELAEKARFCALCGAKVEQPGQVLPEHVAPQVVLADRYRILRQLGVEGTGVVWLAQDLAGNAPIVVKVLPNIVTETDSHLAEIKRRADLWLRLDHPNIVRLLSLELSPFPFLVVEHVEGRSAESLLHQRIEEGHKRNMVGHFPVDEVLSFLPGLASGLDHAHGREVLHLDVKPANIILSPAKDGFTARLTNFGITALIRDTAIHPSKQMKQLNDGVPVYMSPEEIQSKPVDSRTDVYSLGVTLFHLLTGQHPFLTRSQIGIAASMPSAPKVSGEIHFALQRAMSRVPTNRPSTAAEFVASLEEAHHAVPAVPRMEESLPVSVPGDLQGQPDEVPAADSTLVPNETSEAVPIEREAGSADSTTEDLPREDSANARSSLGTLVSLRRERDLSPASSALPGSLVDPPPNAGNGGPLNRQPTPSAPLSPSASPQQTPTSKPTPARTEEEPPSPVMDWILICGIALIILWVLFQR